MTAATICRVAGGVLVALIGFVLAAGGTQLWRSGPQAWPDVVADAATVRRVAGGMLVMTAVLLVSGGTTIGNVSWGPYAAGIATIALVVLAFWANHALFGSFRATHMITNFVVAAVILALLWFGRSEPPL